MMQQQVPKELWDKVKVALRELAANGVEDTLRSKGITGDFSCAGCPIAHYLAQEVELLDTVQIQVTWGSIGLVSRQDPHSGRYLRWVDGEFEEIEAFIRRFDLFELPEFLKQS